MNQKEQIKNKDFFQCALMKSPQKWNRKRQPSEKINLYSLGNPGAPNVCGRFQFKSHNKIGDRTLLKVDQCPYLALKAHVIPAPQLWDPVREAQALLERLCASEMAS